MNDRVRPDNDDVAEIADRSAEVLKSSLRSEVSVIIETSNFLHSLSEDLRNDVLTLINSLHAYIDSDRDEAAFRLLLAPRVIRNRIVKCAQALRQTSDDKGQLAGFLQYMMNLCRQVSGIDDYLFGQIFPPELLPLEVPAKSLAK